MKDTNTKTKKASASKDDARNTVKEPALVMYVGPTLTKYGVIQNIIYNSLPETAVAMMDKIPLFRTLFIEPSDYPKAEKSIREQSGHYWSAYESALNYKEVK